MCSSDLSSIVVTRQGRGEMADELRVTVVATGLGNQEIEKPKTVIDNTRDDTRKKIAGGALDYGDFEIPTVMRKAEAEGSSADLDSPKDMQYLDVPAFLRRQAD